MRGTRLSLMGRHVARMRVCGIGGSGRASSHSFSIQDGDRVHRARVGIFPRAADRGGRARIYPTQQGLRED